VERFLQIESGLNPDFIFTLKSCPRMSTHKEEEYFCAAIVRRPFSPQIFFVGFYLSHYIFFHATREFQMKTITLETPVVSECSVTECAYNLNSGCHARAIAIGDRVHPGCDTFFSNRNHTQAAMRTAGIGACKTEAASSTLTLNASPRTSGLGAARAKSAA